MAKKFKAYVERPKPKKRPRVHKKSKNKDIVSPGHVFPLVARSGGVLERAGHTEASVDISKLANLNPSAVICEIMNQDGRMARMNDLIGFSKKHKLKIASIEDLISFRLKNEKLIIFVAYVAAFLGMCGHASSEFFVELEMLVFVYALLFHICL